MEPIDGLNMTKDAFSGIEEVGSLLFHEYPTTIVYMQQDEQLLVREWVDCSDDGKQDRYFFFKTDPKLLAKFIYGEMSHLDFIKCSLDGFYYFFNSDGKTSSDFDVLSFKQIPQDYLPSSDFFLEKDDVVDFNRINDRLNIDSIDRVTDLSNVVSQIAMRKNTNLFNLHVIKGKSASYGRMKTAALGKLLSDFDLLYRSVALDIHLGKDRGEVNIKKDPGHDDWEKYTSTEVVDTLAASFSVLIQPSFDEPSMFDDMSSSEVTAKYIFELFNNSADEKKIKSVFESFSVFSMSSYKELLKDIYKQNIELGVHFHSNFRKQILTQKYDIRLADKIIKGIEKLSFNEEKKIKRVGRFRAVNCDTAHFVFVTNDDESYSGWFDKSVRENIVYISFTSLYNIHVDRLITKHASKEKPEIKDTISSYYEEK